MKYCINNKKINDVLDELGEEYKDLLIEKALSLHQEYDVDQINLSTIIKFDEKAKDTLLSSERIDTKIRLLSITNISGLFYSIIGIILGIFELSQPYSNDIMITVSFILVIVGVLLSLFSVILKDNNNSFPPKIEETSNYFNFQIINTWKQIEGLLVQLTPAEENSSLNKMITNLSDIKLLSENDISTIKKLLYFRNQVVHSENIKKRYKTNEIKNLLRDSNMIIKKLENFENR